MFQPCVCLAADAFFRSVNIVDVKYFVYKMAQKRNDKIVLKKLNRF